MRIQTSLLLVTAGLALAGCGSVNNYMAAKQTTVEYYRVFDIQTSASKQQVAKAASDGLGRNVNGASEAMPIITTGIPEQPGRFNLVDPFAGTNFSAFVGGAGSIGVHIAKCDGAVWTAHAVRNISGSNNLNIYACLYQYKGGYQLDQYAVFTKEEGGLMQLSRDMANAMVGTPEQWTDKTLLDVVRNIEATTQAKISLVEAQPDVAGTPWLDSIVKP